MRLNHRIVTISARNYLSRSATLARSYADVNPGEKVIIVLVDAKRGEIPSTDFFEVATPEDLPIDSDEFLRMAMIYDVTELCTSIKPWVLQMVLRTGADVATYLDPDIEVFSPLDDLAEAASASGIALTPHTLMPFPRDGLQPTESDIMLAGGFNLGYVSVSGDGEPMLEWWKERLARYSIVAPDQAVFVDQRWIDMVPSYFSHTVIRDPGYNVAYWNLHERSLTRVGDQVMVNGQPLRFFHYSGYRGDKPWILNKYYADRPRVLMSEHPVVLDLCEQYRKKLDEVEDQFQSLDTPYGFDTLADDTPVLPELRRAYRQGLIKAELDGSELPPIPFESGDDSLGNWLATPASPNSAVTNFLINLWRSRLDLKAAFPDPTGRNADDLCGWASQYLAVMPPDWIRSVRSRALSGIRMTEPLSEEPGLNVSGYFKAELGVGEAGRRLLDAVRLSGLPFRTALTSETLSRQNVDFTDVAERVRYPISVAAVNADVFPEWATTVGASLCDDTYMIGHWAWELEEFQDPSGALNLVDEIWANSNFTRAAMLKVTSKPVFTLPLPVREPDPSVELDRQAIGLSDRPYFLFAFDFFSVMERKNPLGLIDAFKRAFREGEGPQLVIKSINGDARPSQREQLRLASRDRSDIHLLEEYLDSDQVGALMNEALAYVSLHRSEGLGFTLAEAMSYGKPVIATGYSGNLDFMTDDTSLLVPVRKVDVGPGCAPYPSTATWAEPNLDVAARHMRWVVDNPESAKDLGQRAAAHILSERSLEHAAEFVRGRVEQIVSSGALWKKRVTTSTPVDTPAPIGRARALVHSAPNVGSPSRFPALAKRYRQLIYMSLAHHDERRNDQLTAILDALAAIAEDSSSEADQTRRMLQGQIKLLASRWDRVEDRQRRLVAEGIRPVEELIDATGRDIDDRLLAISTKLQQIDIELVARPYTSSEGAGTYVNSEGRRVMGYRSDTSSLTSYADFEDTYRGNEEAVSLMLEPYLPILSGKDPVFEVGSGRGELLDLLGEAGIKATGAELDQSMYERCIAKGLDVRLGDGLDMLRKTAEQSLGAVVSFQVIEHLQPGEIEEFFELAQRALRPEGVFVAETVNPHSPPALKAFWLDLTHVRPLYPESLLMLAQQSGFDSAEIMFPFSKDNLDDDLRSSGSFALVARRG